MTASIEERSELNTAEGAEVPERRQVGQLTEVFLEGREDDPLIVRITNRERIHYEKTRAKRSWPAATEAQSIAMTFCTWSAAKRAGQTALTYEQWEDVLIEWEVVRAIAADPTRPTASPTAT